jgi:hypothetical protein
MAAAVINYADGREALVFTNGVAGWSTSSLVISHFVVSWITKGVIPGQRQVLLNTQVGWLVTWGCCQQLHLLWHADAMVYVIIASAGCFVQPWQQLQVK